MWRETFSTRGSQRWLVVGLIVAALPVAGCRSASGAERVNGTRAEKKPSAITVQRGVGAEFTRVTLTAQAAERLDIKTAAVREWSLPRSGSAVGPRKIIPYAAVLYDARSETWVYTNPEPLVFVRHRIKVDYIEADIAVVSDGPPIGTQVVTGGAALLFGTEFEAGR